MSIIKPSTAFKAGADWVSAEVRAYHTDQTPIHVDTVSDVRDNDFERARWIYVRAKSADYRLDLSSGAADDGDTVLHDNVGRRYLKVAGSGGTQSWNVQVDELSDRSAYDGEDAGFVVLVSDTGSGRAALYTMGDGGSGDWSDPAYLTPANAGGNVSGPSSSTDGHVAVFDGATGKAIKDAGFAPADASALSAHIADDDNPHAVTKSQVGLGNVDNTSDADKPVSTAQAAAMYKAATLGPVANLLVPAEPAAAAFDLLALAGLIRDDEDRAKSWAGDPNDKLTYASPSTKWVSNRAGVLVPGTALRCDHDPVTGAGLGVRSEPQSTNLVRNPRAEGAVPGTPGTLPTYWSNNPANGIQQEVVGTGVEDGIHYLDIRSFGTATANHAIAIYYEQSSAMLVSVGETITNSCFVRRVGGSMDNIIGMGLLLWEATATGSPNGAATNTSIIGMTDAPLRTQRWKHTKTMANEGTARVFSQIRFNVNSGNTIDITLRIGLPLIEKQPIATSPILPPTGSPAQTTRAADNISLPAAALPWNNLAGTVFMDFMPAQPGYSSGFNRGIFAIERTSSQTYSVIVTMRGSNQDFFARVAGADGNGVATSAAAADVPRYKMALAWRVGRAVLAINGTLYTLSPTLTSSDLPTDPVTFRIGASRGGSTPLGGSVRSAFYLPYDISDGELQARTTL